MKKAGMDKTYYQNLVCMVIAGMLALTSFSSFAAPFAYIGNSFEKVIIDTATNTEVDTIAVFQVGKVAVHPSGDFLYGLKFGRYGGLLNVYDTSNNNLLAEIPMADEFVTMSHLDLVVHPSGDFVYVMSTSHESTGNRLILSIVDTNINAISATIEVSEVSTQGAIILAIHPTGDFLYVANRSEGAITVFDTNTLQSVAKIDINGGFSGLAVHPTGQYLYTSGGRVQVIDTTTYSVVDSILTNRPSSDVKIHPDGNTIYVSHYRNRSITVIDVNANTVTTTISLPYYPNAIAMHPSGDFLYMIGIRFADGWESVVAVINKIGRAHV